MNVDPADAVVLGKILADVPARRREAGFLDADQARRRLAAARLLRSADRLIWAATMRRWRERLVRNLVLSMSESRLPTTTSRSSAARRRARRPGR
jgi:2-polyprenyl-6-methoxyphenol hydroxylase-like FAD-dependent oxidoreductase